MTTPAGLTETNSATTDLGTSIRIVVVAPPPTAPRVFSSAAPGPLLAAAAVEAVQASAPVTVRPLVLSVLRLLALTPLATNSPTDPAAPVVSPLEALFVSRRLVFPSPFNQPDTATASLPVTNLTAQSVSGSSPQINFQNITTSGVDEDALTVDTPGRTLLNFGRLTTTGDLADGIFAPADNVNIANFSRIETSGLGAAGISVVGQDANITNFGSIVTHGDLRDPNPEEDGEEGEAFSEGMTAVGDRFRITNFGTIHVEGDVSSAMSAVGNDGSIVNAGIANSRAAGSSVIGVFGDRSQAINAGITTVDADEVTAVLVVGEGSISRNAGFIAMTGTGNVGVEGVRANDRLKNRAVID